MSVHQTIVAEPMATTKRIRASWPLVFALIAAVAVNLYALCWATVPPDLVQFVIPWYGHILERGPVDAFTEPFSNYTPPYLYLLAASSLVHPLVQPVDVIKWLSVAGTGFLALAVADLVKALGAEPKRAAFTFVVPTIALNAALLGQCDALWAGACVLAVAAMIRGTTVKSLVWCGVGIAFKAQAAFVAPFIIGSLIGRRAPLWQWSIPALVYAALMAPAWLLGWPAADLATVYLRQAGWFDTAGNLANPWIWAGQFAPDAAKPLYILGYVTAAAAALGIGILAASCVRKPKALLMLALLSAFALPFLLPKMHERYYFLADALVLALALATPTRHNLYITATVQIASLLSVLTYVYFYFHPVPALAGTFVAAISLAAIWRETLASGAHWPFGRKTTGNLTANQSQGSRSTGLRGRM
jgi:Gpi18-like mannosyltransferase